MMNRFFAIRFPIQAQLFNNTNINPGEAVQIWADMLGGIYSTTPKFIWDGLKKTKKQKKENKLHILELSTLQYYAGKHQLSITQVEEAIIYFGEPFINELKIIEKATKK
jgi:hypothetical protein